MLFLIVFVLLASCQQKIGSDTRVASTATPDILATISYIPPTETFSKPPPEWLKDPNVNILLHKYFRHVVFINPEIEESYRLELSGVDWISNNLVGFEPIDFDECLSGRIYSSTFNLLTSVVKEYSLAENIPLEYCVPIGQQVYARIGSFDENIIHINGVDVEKNEIVLTLPDNSFINDVENSQDKVFALMGPEIGLYSGIHLVVYDFLSQEILMVVDSENISYPIVFSDEYDKLLYVDGQTPCVLDGLTLDIACGVKIPFEYSDIRLAGFWQNNTTVMFLARRDSIGPPWANGNKLCSFGMFSGEIECFIENAAIFEPYDLQIGSGEQSEMQEVVDSIIGYKFSPDNKYILVCYGQNFRPDRHIAIVDVNELSFYEVPTYDLEYQNWQTTCPSSSVNWRPMP